MSTSGLLVRRHIGFGLNPCKCHLVLEDIIHSLITFKTRNSNNNSELSAFDYKFQGSKNVPHSGALGCHAGLAHCERVNIA